MEKETQMHCADISFLSLLTQKMRTPSKKTTRLFSDNRELWKASMSS